MFFSNRPTLNPDGSVPGSFYDREYWEEGAKSGKGSYNGNAYEDNPEACKYWAKDCYNRWGPFTSFLELGCGRGWNCYGFLRQPELGVRYLGVDISQYAIQTAPQDVRPFLHHGDVADLSFIPDGDFETIFSNDMMEHLTPAQAKSCLEHCRRIATKRVVHLISIGDDVYHEEGKAPADQDQSHINMKPTLWWADLFYQVFGRGGSNGWNVLLTQHGRSVELDAQKI